MRQFAIFVVAISASLAAIGSSHAQTSRDFSGPRTHYTDGLVGQFDDSAADVLTAPATVSAKFTPPSADRPAILLITAKIARGKHAYSLTQPAGGPQPTTIELEPSPNYRRLSNFRSQPAPKSHLEELAPGKNIKVEEHEGQVTWYAPIELTAGVDPNTVEIRGAVHMQVCQTHGLCESVDKEFVAQQHDMADVGVRLADLQPKSNIADAQAAVGKFKPENSMITLEGRLVPATVRPGESAELQITAILPSHGHVYAHADRDDKLGAKPVLIAIETASGLVPHRPTTEASTKSEESVFGPKLYHEGQVTWSLRVDVPNNAKPGDYSISGLFGYTACGPDEKGNIYCETPPKGVRFAAVLKVGDQASQVAAPLTFAMAQSYKQVSEAAAVFADNFSASKLTGASRALTSKEIKSEASNTPVLRSADQYELSRVVLGNAAGGSLSYYIALAFVGGLILNLMPCVLPVIGLKVMSFVEQSGKSRSHALLLNLWFAGGIVAVFLLLGLLASLPQLGLGEKALGWGGQFGNTVFNVTLAAIVFAMALSLLGVWEIPIPGFFGSSAVQNAAAKEGPLGAFLKGIVTTVLATPCTAPFMASAIPWAITQNVTTILVVFASLGIGMASPYILVGAYPELLRFLPKPGAWMETFKQICGFVLLATVVFILSFIETTAIVPTLALLLGIGVACWFISRTPLTAEFNDRIKSWAIAGTIVLLFVAASIGLYRITKTPADTAWQPFSLERLKQVAVDEGRTVLVDFSADWCINCKVLERTVLHTKPVEQAIASSGAVTMYGDYTKYPPEIDDTIKALGANGVPVIAIFPGDAPYEPIVFRGGYRQQDIITALDQARARRISTASAPIAEAGAPSTPRN